MEEELLEKSLFSITRKLEIVERPKKTTIILDDANCDW